MSAEDDARERRDAWIAAGAPDHNAPTHDSGGSISGYQSVADQPSYARSESNQNVARNSGGSVYESGTPWFSPGGGGSSIRNNPNPSQSGVNPFSGIGTAATAAAQGTAGTQPQSTVTPTGYSGTQGEGAVKARMLLDNPKAAMKQVIASMGLTDDNNPMANWIRTKASLIEPLYLMWQSNSPTEKIDPADYVTYMRDYLLSLGNVGGSSPQQQIQGALGMGGAQQPDVWNKYFNAINPETQRPYTSQAEQQYMLNRLFDIMSMGTTNPWSVFKGGKIAGSTDDYAHGMTTGNVPTGASFLRYLQSHPELFGW